MFLQFKQGAIASAGVCNQYTLNSIFDHFVYIICSIVVYIDFQVVCL